MGKKGTTTVSSYAYTYDLAGRKIQTVDLNGTTNYTYDALGRLTSETGPSVANTFTYDSRGNRTASTKNGIATAYTYDLANRLTSSVTSGITTTYTYDDNGNTVTSKKGSNSAIQYSYNLANNSGTITDSYRYDAFGTQLNTVDDTNPFQYCGEYLDEENGMYYLRARNYVPDLGRFTQWDSYNGDPKNPISLNHYVYCYNDPIGLRDPSGNIPVETFLDVGSFVVSAYQLKNDPTWANLGWLIADGLAVIVPYASGTYVVKAVGKTDELVDTIKYVDIGTDTASAINKSQVLEGTGLYSKVKGHHVHAKAAFKGNLKYSPEKGFAIGREFMDQYGLNHQKITATQRELFKELYESGRPNTLEEHIRIAKAALKAGGASDDLAKNLVEESLRNLKGQGVIQPTRIPWYTK